MYGGIAEIYRHRKLIAHRLVQPENKLPAPRELVDLRQALKGQTSRRLCSKLFLLVYYSFMRHWILNLTTDSVFSTQKYQSLRLEMIFRTRFRELNFISLFASINTIFLSPHSRPCVFCCFFFVLFLYYLSL